MGRNLPPDELGGLITAVHRTTQLSLPVVLVGAGLQLPGLAGEAKSYAERLFDFPFIGSLSEDDAKAAIAIPAQERGVKFTADALGVILSESQGYPYFLQEWGYAVWNNASATPISEDDVTSVRPFVSIDSTGTLPLRADRLDTPQARLPPRHGRTSGPSLK